MGMFLVEHPTVFISCNLFGSPECLVMFLTSTLEIILLLTAELLNQDYQNYKLSKDFSKFYRRHFNLVSKFSVDLNRFCNKTYRNLNFMVT